MYQTGCRNPSQPLLPPRKRTKGKGEGWVAEVAPLWLLGSCREVGESIFQVSHGRRTFTLPCFSSARLLGVSVLNLRSSESAAHT